jgi:hypothetical protein
MEGKFEIKEKIYCSKIMLGFKRTQDFVLFCFMHNSPMKFGVNNCTKLKIIQIAISTLKKKRLHINNL